PRAALADAARPRLASARGAAGSGALPPRARRGTRLRRPDAQGTPASLQGLARPRAHPPFALGLRMAARVPLVAAHRGVEAGRLRGREHGRPDLPTPDEPPPPPRGRCQSVDAAGRTGSGPHDTPRVARPARRPVRLGRHGGVRRTALAAPRPPLLPPGESPRRGRPGSADLGPVAATGRRRTGRPQPR